jgi:hypothetical protein
VQILLGASLRLALTGLAFAAIRRDTRRYGDAVVAVAERVFGRGLVDCGVARTGVGVATPGSPHTTA